MDVFEEAEKIDGKETDRIPNECHMEEEIEMSSKEGDIVDMFEVGVISPGTLSLVYILRVRGLLEEFGRFKMLLKLFSIKTFYFYFYFYFEKIININTSPYILHNIL